jgi:hypothetical protein
MDGMFSRCANFLDARVNYFGLLRMRTLLLPAVLAGLAGCYSFSGTTLPSHLRTLRILPVGNKTLESALPDRVSQGLEDGFRQRTNLRKVNEGGDAELSATLTSYSHRPQSISGDRVTHYRVDILLSVAFVDREKGDTLYQDSQVPGYGPYSIDKGETEEVGQRLAIESAVKVILDQAVSGW